MVGGFQHRYSRKHKAIWSTELRVGDIFYVAEHDLDRAWRVQAILALGMVRFGNASGSERELAVETLKKYRQHSEPLYAAAAEAALTMTQEEFRQIGAGQ